MKIKFYIPYNKNNVCCQLTCHIPAHGYAPHNELRTIKTHTKKTLSMNKAFLKDEQYLNSSTGLPTPSLYVTYMGKFTNKQGITIHSNFFAFPCKFSESLN